jgi:hypothetical protein
MCLRKLPSKENYFSKEFLYLLKKLKQATNVLDVVRGPSNPHDPESDAGGSLSFWQGHTSR